jgi:serine/threonine-protein kinase
MLLVEEGTFLMGSDTADSDERPAHIVMLDNFYIDKHEVTNAEYKVCVDSLHCSLPKNTVFYVSPVYRSHPVVFVSWEMAAEYCNWRDARLPTEAEWEKAARGDDNYLYPWGNTFDGHALNFCDVECTYSWADKNYRDRYTMTAPVGIYPDGVSTYGLYDMAGNVAEWVGDWYAKDYYSRSPLANPTGPEEGIYRVLRGGSWYNAKLDVRTFTRSHLRPDVAYNYTGFRCASDPPLP